jgi:acetylornithine deacetylase/succinyl-diaminopimelate desuccinylase-like protein
MSRIEDEATGEILLPELRGGGVPDTERANIVAVAQEFPDGAFPAVDGLQLLGATQVDRFIAKAWSPALEVTGMDGIPATRNGGNVLRPFTKAKFSLRLPPDVDAQVAADAVIAAITTDEGAHVTIDMEPPANGWISPPLPAAVAETLARASQMSFGRDPGYFGEGGTIPFLADLQRSFPTTPIVATGVLGPHSNAHGPNEFLHIPMAKAVTNAVAELLK